MSAIDMLIIGGSGFVGAKLVQTALKAGRNIAYTYLRSPLPMPAASFRLQIQDDAALESCIAETRPLCIVYCAVPLPKSDDFLHDIVSVKGISRVCAELQKSGNCKLIYVSTNSVFSGQNGPYCENDTPDPERRHEKYRVYAMTRAQGEQIALKAWHNTIVVRTSDVNGKDRTGSLNPRMSDLVSQLKSGNTTERSMNAFISPTLVDNLADSLLEISRPDFYYRGVLHLAGCEQTSYFDFACRIADKIGADKALVTQETANKWNIALDTEYSQGMLRTPFLNIDEQLSVMFS